MSGVSGRFLTRDPIGYQGGRNLIQYVNGRPLVKVDPRGLIQEQPPLDGSGPTLPSVPSLPRYSPPGVSYKCTGAINIGTTPIGIFLEEGVISSSSFGLCGSISWRLQSIDPMPQSLVFVGPECDGVDSNTIIASLNDFKPTANCTTSFTCDGDCGCTSLTGGTRRFSIPLYVPFPVYVNEAPVRCTAWGWFVFHGRFDWLMGVCGGKRITSQTPPNSPVLPPLPELPPR